MGRWGEREARILQKLQLFRASILCQGRGVDVRGHHDEAN